MWFAPLHITVACLSGKLTGKQKKLIQQDILDHKINIVIGTHALFQEQIKFHKLSLGDH